MIDWKKRMAIDAATRAKAEKLKDKVPEIHIETDNVKNKELQRAIREELMTANQFTVKQYEQFQIRTEPFVYECIFFRPKVTVLHFKPQKRFMTERHYKWIFDWIVNEFKHKAFAFKGVEGVETREVGSFDIIIYGSRLKLGDKKYWQRLGERLAEDFARKFI